MKKKITIPLAVIVILVVSFIFITNLTNSKKLENLKVSESKIEFYPSQRHMIVLTSTKSIDENQLRFKSKDIDVQKVQCITADSGESQCALSLSGFKPTSEKVEIRYGDKVYYVDTKIKSLDKSTKNMSLDEQYEIALAKLLTKYRVIVPDDIKDEKVRLKVENQIEKLKDKYSSE